MTGMDVHVAVSPMTLSGFESAFKSQLDKFFLLFTIFSHLLFSLHLDMCLHYTSPVVNIYYFMNDFLLLYSDL